MFKMSQSAWKLVEEHHAFPWMNQRINQSFCSTGNNRPTTGDIKVRVAGRTRNRFALGYSKGNATQRELVLTSFLSIGLRVQSCCQVGKEFSTNVGNSITHHIEESANMRWLIKAIDRVRLVVEQFLEAQSGKAVHFDNMPNSFALSKCAAQNPFFFK